MKSSATETVALNGALIEAERVYLMRYARSKLRDPHAAEDAVQDTLLAALKGMPEFAGRSTLRTWLTSILKHKIVDIYRRDGVEKNVSAQARDAEGDEVDLLDLRAAAADPSPESSPEGALQQRQLFDLVYAGLRDLPPAHRDVFVLREISGLGCAEICAVLGISKANAWVMLHRARQALRGRVEREWFAAA